MARHTFDAGPSFGWREVLWALAIVVVCSLECAEPTRKQQALEQALEERTPLRVRHP